MAEPAPKGGFYLPALDGIRGLAFLLVFLLHAISSIYTRADTSGFTALSRGLMDFGRYGVSLFFVLSSFLVTTLLLRERDRLGSVDVGAFVIRRALRIWPLYFAFLLIYFVKGRVPYTGAISLPLLDTVAYGTFMGDIFHMFATHGVLTHLWSIGVEEKFYLAWPWALRRASRERLLKIVVGVFVLQWVLRLVLPPFVSFSWFLYGPLGYLDCLALGAAIALLPLDRLPKLAALWRLAPAPALALFVAVLVLATTVGFALDGPAQEGWGLPLAQGLAAIAGGLFVAALKDRLEGWPANRPLVELGKRSYGAYILHTPIIGVTAALAAPGPSVRGILVRVFALVITLALAWLSYRFFETPFLRLKSRFQRVPSGSPSGVAPAG